MIVAAAGVEGNCGSVAFEVAVETGDVEAGDVGCGGVGCGGVGLGLSATGVDCVGLAAGGGSFGGGSAEEGVVIGDDVSIAAGVVITAA